MTSGVESRFERLELKYLIDEHTADRIHRQIQPYCRPDAHNPRHRGGRDERGYGISSLYLDSANLTFHRAKERGDPNRVKLRIRTYDGSSVAVLEVKQKTAEVVAKMRFALDRNEAVDAACGWTREQADIVDETGALGRFVGTATRAGALPTLHVRYRREAFASTVDDYARVTFDRGIRAQRARDWSLDPDPERWCDFDDAWRPDYRATPVVLELKCQSRVPHWLTDIIRMNELDRRSFSKYSIGIHLTRIESASDAIGMRSAKVMQ